jgi:hypothetical protein
VGEFSAESETVGAHPDPPHSPAAPGGEGAERSPQTSPLSALRQGREQGARPPHRSFNVASPASASTRLTIQKRMTTVDSLHPSCS